VTASFAADTFTLSYAAGAGGSLTGNLSQTVAYGQDGTPVTAVADAGYHFVSWSDGSTANPRTDTHVTGNISVTASFAQDEYTLIVEVIPAEGGTITIQPEQATYLSGATVNLEAVPSIGWTFVEWTGDISSSASVQSIVMDSNKHIVAHFAESEYTLNILTEGSGTVSAVPVPPYTYNEEVTLTAEAATGWHFVRWTGDLGGSDNPATLALDGNKTVTAVFEKDAVTLAVNVTGSGAVTAEPAGPFLSGDTVTLTAEAATGWHFDSWTGDLGGSDNPATLTLDGNKTVTATFLMDPVTCYALALTHTGHGADPVASPGSSGGCDAGQYVEGANINLSGAAPEAGWQIGGWSGTTDDSSVAGTNMVVMPAGAHTVSIIYTQREYSLTIHTTGSGSVTADPAGPYHYGDTVTLTAIPDAGWMFAGWDACAGTGTCTVTLSADTTITATFTLIEYTLTTSVIGNGSITLDNPGPYHLGDMVQLTATPASGWGFSAWGGDLSGSANPANITIDGNKTVSATFRDATAPDTIINTHPANPSSVDSATFTFTGTDNVTPSASLTFECELDSGAWASCTSPAPYSSLANGTHTFSVRAADAASNVDATPATFTWTVAVSNNQAPVANAGGPYTGYEGSSFNLSAAKSTDPDNNITLYQWDLDNDGQFDDATGKTARFTAVDNGTYTVRVQVTDADGLTSTASASVTVKNVAPKITSLAVSNWTRVKTPVYTQVKFSDPGANDTFTVTWTWGDGTSSSGVVGTNSATGSHTYTRAGIYFVTATVKDKDGGVAAKYTVIIVLPR
jgi:hypothetical protein